MKELGSILFVFAILFPGGNQGTFSNIHNVFPDSSKVNAAPVMQEDSTTGPMAQQPDFDSKYKYLTIDCPFSQPDSTSPTMKTFVPDSKLADFMPIFKPEKLDTGMLAGDCFMRVPEN